MEKNSCFTCSQRVPESSSHCFCLKQICKILKLQLDLNQDFVSDTAKIIVCTPCFELLNHADMLTKEIENVIDKIKNIMTTNFTNDSSDPAYSMRKSFIQCWEGWSVQVINLDLEENDPSQIAQKVYFSYLNPDDDSSNVRLNPEDKHSLTQSVPIVVMSRPDQSTERYFETKMSITTVHLPTEEAHNDNGEIMENHHQNLEFITDPSLSTKNDRGGGDGRSERVVVNKRPIFGTDWVGGDEASLNEESNQGGVLKDNTIRKVQLNVQISKPTTSDSVHNSDSKVNCDDSSSSSQQGDDSNSNRKQTSQENSTGEIKRRKQASVVETDDGQFVYDGKYYFKKVDNGFACLHCDKETLTRKVIVAHMRRHKLISALRFSCKICSKSFVSPRDLAGHEKSCPHLQVKTPVVQVDEGKFCYGGTYYFYKTESDTGQAKFKCGTCGVEKTKRNMMMHLRCHRVADSKQFTCEKCGLSRVTQRDLDKHQRACSKGPRVVEIEPNVYIYAGKYRFEATEFGFKCHTCGGVSVNKPSMMVHLKRHRGKDSKLHACQPCGRSFAFKQELLTHQLNHSEAKRRTTSVKYGPRNYLYGGQWKYEQLAEGDFRCDTCKTVTKTRKKMTLHLLRNHADPQRYCCDLCGASFGSSSVFKSHQSTHTSVRPYQCHICGKMYKTQSQLCSHKHTHETWQCEVCGKKLYSKFLLREHTLAHAGIKSYKCSRCDREFQHRKGLTNHWKKHNDVTDFRCNEPQCSMSFLQKRELAKHLSSAHSVVNVVEIMPSMEEVVLIEDKDDQQSVTEIVLKSSEEEEDDGQYQQQLTITFNS